MDPISQGLLLLDAEAPKKGILIDSLPSNPRSRTYTVPTMDGRKQMVHAIAMRDSIFEERLELYSISVRELPVDAGLLLGLLAAAKDFRKARLCIYDVNRPQLVVVASFVPDELQPGAGPLLLHALREVAAVADSLELQITGADDE